VICIVDVHYEPDRVTAAAIGAEWDDEIAAIEVVVRTPGPAADYNPGAFYERELPYLLGVLERMPPVEVVVVDGYVWLGPDQPGLGWHLHRVRPGPVIGIAKTPFAGAISQDIIRGDSGRPLHITAIDFDDTTAAARVRAMHGVHRIPTLVRRADALARGQR
jgi:deoxyribonuclease V